MRRSAGAHPHVRIPPSSKTPAPTHDSDHHPRSRPLRRRRSSLLGAAAHWRRGAAAAGGGRKQGGPVTPLVQWKFDDAGLFSEKPAARSESGVKSRSKPKSASAGSGAAAAAVSARKLAAGIWQLQLPEVSGLAKRVSAWPVLGHIQTSYDGKLDITCFHKDSKNEFQSPISIPNLSNGVSKIEHPVALPNCAMERATKWDPGFSKASEMNYRFYGHLKLLEDQHVSTVSVVSTLQTELEQARTNINELEAERRLSKKKFDHILRKLAEEKASWRSREHEKVHAIIDDIKDDLNRERKNRQRMEILNSKLVNELAESKLSAKRYLQDYEKEHKARELMEEVCDELAKEIGDDKAEIEASKRESMKIREEVEEERKMLQMAEVWREERVQMKLIDAKLTLEEKYSHLSKLQSDLEAFLRSRSRTRPDVAEIREAELLREAANSVKVQEIKQFSYQPPLPSEDIFSVFEELHPGVETNEREIEPCYGCSPASRSSKIHTVSPEINGFNEKSMKMYTNGTTGRNEDVEDDSGWETVSHGEEHGSSNSPEESDPSVDEFCESNASVSGTDWEENAENGKVNCEVSGVCSATTRQSWKKASSITKLWRSSHLNNGENHKIISAEAMNGRLSNGTLSPGMGLGEVGFSPQSVGNWSSPDSVNPRITRGMKGCIEWPLGMQKHSLKARMESQKIQLRHVLKQKI